MTTPAPCADPQPHNRHPVGWSDLDCPGVEPPADVQATPDPRLDVVASEIHSEYCAFVEPCDEHDGCDYREIALRILDALDAMRPDVDRRVEHRAQEHLRSWLGTSSSETYTPPAPAGLTPAQEIRLRVFEGQKWKSENTAAEWAAWVEHGEDEMPASECDGLCNASVSHGNAAVHRQIVDKLIERAEHAEVRADLAEARLGHIKDASERGLTDAEFRDATIAALTLPLSMLRVADWATEPADTATADAATGDE